MDHQLRYHAFISYRHADNTEQGRQWATWLHQAIETYEVPIDLVGKHNDLGEEIPASIYPIFRDEEELPAHADLASSITKSLEMSRILIVLCSPRAVESTYVASEIEYFKQIGKAGKILAAIIAGEPNTSLDKGKQKAGFTVEDECFPAPIQFEYDNEGNRTGKRAEPIAADFRVHRDGVPEQGWTSPEAYRLYLQQTSELSKKEIKKEVGSYLQQQHLMLLKIIAGILGIPLGKLTLRDKAYQLTQARQKAKKLKRWLGAIAVLATLSVIAGGFAYFQKQEAVLQKMKAVEQTEIAKKQKNIAEKEKKKATEQRDIAEQQKKIATENEQLANKRLKESYQNLGIQSFLADKADDALTYFKEIITLDPHYSPIETALADVWSHIRFLKTNIAGEDNKIVSLTFSADGKRLTSQDDHGRIRIVDITDGHILKTSKGYDGYMESTLLTTGGKQLADFSQSVNPAKPDHVLWNINLVDLPSGDIVEQLKWLNYEEKPELLLLSKNGTYLMVGADGYGQSNCYIWKTGEGSNQLITIPAVDQFQNYKWYFSADERFLLQIKHTGDGFSMVVRDSGTGNKLQSFPLSGRVEAIDLFDEKVALGLSNGTMSLFNLAQESVLSWQDSSAHMQNSAISSVDFSSDGTLLLSIDSISGSVVLQNAETGSILSKMKIETSEVIHTSALSPDGNFVAIGHGRNIDIYQKGSNALLYQFTIPGVAVNTLAFNQTSSSIAAASRKGDIKVWSLENRQEQREVKVKLPAVESGFSKLRAIDNNDYFAYGSSVYLFAGKTKTFTKIDSNSATDYAFLPHHNLWANTNYTSLHIEKHDDTNEVSLEWNLPGLKLAPHLFPAPANSPVALLVAFKHGCLVAYAPDGQLLKLNHTGKDSTGSPFQATFSADGNVGLVSFNGGVILQFTLNGKGIGEVKRHHLKELAGCAAELLEFDSQSKILLLRNSENGLFYIYNTDSKIALPLGQASVSGAALYRSADELMVVTVGLRGNVGLWDQQGKLVAKSEPPQFHTEESLSWMQAKGGTGIAIDPGEGKVVTTYGDQIYLWSLSDLTLLWRSKPLAQGNNVNIVFFNQDKKVVTITSHNSIGNTIDTILYVTIPHSIPTAEDMEHYIKNVSRQRIVQGRVVPMLSE